jgi:hypothetical protein
MLVVRGLGETTVVVVIEGDASGHVRMREIPTLGLFQVLPAQTPEPGCEPVETGGEHG